MRPIAVLALCLASACATFYCGGGHTSAPSGGEGSGPVTLGSLDPIVAEQNGPAFSLTVNGSGFSSGDQVTFNGTPEPTTVTNNQQLTAQIPSSALIAPSTTNGFPVGVRGGANSPTPISFYVVPAITPNTVSVSAGGAASGVNIQPAPLTPTLQLQSIGGCVCTTATTTGTPDVAVSPGQTVNLFVVGNGVVAGTYYIISGAGITVSQPIAANFTQTMSPVTPAVNFNIVVSGTAAAGPRNLIVTNAAGEISIYPGAVVVNSP